LAVRVIEVAPSPVTEKTIKLPSTKLTVPATGVDDVVHTAFSQVAVAVAFSVVPVGSNHIFPYASRAAKDKNSARQLKDCRLKGFRVWVFIVGG
jgi:hypothetical protein